LAKALSTIRVARAFVCLLPFLADLGAARSFPVACAGLPDPSRGAEGSVGVTSPFVAPRALMMRTEPSDLSTDETVSSHPLIECPIISS